MSLGYKDMLQGIEDSLHEHFWISDDQCQASPEIPPLAPLDRAEDELEIFTFQAYPYELRWSE